jgi:hypothetical protein
MTPFEKQLYDMANEIVGNVGKVKPLNRVDSADNRISVTGEEYVSFLIRFDSEDDVLEKWSQLVESYKYVATYNMHNVSESNAYRKTGIYWRVTPEIEEHKTRKKPNEILGKPGGYWLYARFLISGRT